MIVKEWAGKPTTDIKLKAGQEAEKQMAFYLKREFGKDKNIFVFNNLRVVHEDEVAQIDHLILHPYGFSLVESKSISGSVKINEHDEWIRCYNNKPIGMRSPLIQLKMQRNVLTSFLDSNAEKILGKIFGLIQQGVGRRKFDCIAAISDKTVISRKKETSDVYKADAVSGILRSRIKLYKIELVTGNSVWFNKKELKNIADFLLANDQTEKILIKTPVDKKNWVTKCTASIKEPQSQYSYKASTPKNNEKKPPHICSKCNEPFEIRFGYSFHLYCPNCKNRRISIQPECLQCHHKAKLERQVGTRIVEYICTQNTNHIGIYHKNRGIYLEDKK